MNRPLVPLPWVALIFLAFPPTVAAQATQQHVHDMSHMVMPFDIAKTRHVFSMTDSGGVQRVVVKDKNDRDQIALIRQHLQHEAEAFQKGDFSDPAHLHGATMPGLKDVQAGATKILIRYLPLPDGGQISFDTKAPHLVTAIHRWFGAQLSEHGADAEIE